MASEHGAVPLGGIMVFTNAVVTSATARIVGAIRTQAEGIQPQPGAGPGGSQNRRDEALEPLRPFSPDHFLMVGLRIGLATPGSGDFRLALAVVDP